VKKEDIPSELVTYSGGGLDPDISPEGALVQVKRIAAVRGVKEEKLNELIKRFTEGPLMGLFGPSKVNVLNLNVALDNLH
jgi:K+-transporting ATPase ATPase C chain